MTSPNFKNIDFTVWKKKLDILQLNEELIFGCGNNRLDIVQYVLTSPELQKHADIHYENESALRMACSQGFINIINYILNSPDLKDHANPDIPGLSIIETATYNGRLDVIKYFLNHPKFEASSLKQITGHPLVMASGHGFLDIVQYFLTEPKFKDLTDLHANKESAFKFACSNEQFTIIKYYIFDMNIEKSENITNWLLNRKNDFTIEVDRLLVIRELNKDLNIELDENKSNKMKVKV